MISERIFDALYYLFLAGIISIVFRIARNKAIEIGLKKTILNGLLWCIGIALFSSITLGNPSCEYKSDPVYGGCEEYADDGYEPTNEEKVANFAYFIVLLYTPVVLGALNAEKKR
jgi:hypothetical protein